MNERNTDRLRQFKLAMQTIKECRTEQWEVNSIQEAAKKIEQELSGPGGGAIEFDAKERLKSSVERIIKRRSKGSN